MHQSQWGWHGAPAGCPYDQGESGQPGFGPAIDDRSAILFGSSLGQVTIVGVKATIVTHTPSAIIDSNHFF
jgi:hypothetical protein